MVEWAKYIGGFLHWLLHGCKTELSDEIEGNLTPSWGGSYDLENYILGFLFSIIVLFLVLSIFFSKQ